MPINIEVSAAINSLVVGGSEGGGGGAIAPVDLTLAGGSLRYPENNGETTGDDYRGSLTQSKAGMPQLLTADGALFAILGVPLDRMHENREYRIMQAGAPGGGRTWGLSYHGSDHTSETSRGDFQGRIRGNSGDNIIIKSLSNTAKRVLVVFKRSGDDFSIDLYDLADGTKTAGTAYTHASSTGLDSHSYAIDLAGSNNSLSKPKGRWTGEIESLGYIDRAVLDTEWQAVAAGADIVTTIGATNCRWLREFDGTSDTYGPPAAATNDSTNAFTLDVAPTLFVGSSIRRQSTANFLLFDPTPTGRVWGLKQGETSRSVTFSGIAGGYVGNVQVRVAYADDGVVITNWTTVGSISSGVWSGSITVPKCSGGWAVAQARIEGGDDPIAEMRDLFAVGYKFGILGQSQLQIWAAADGDYILSSPNRMKASVSLDNNYDQVNNFENMQRLGADNISHGAAAFLDTWYEYGDDTPIQLVTYAEAGTGMISLITDSDTDRRWSRLVEIADYAGNDITAMILNWGTNDLGFGVNFGNVFDALWYGTGPEAADHYLTDGTFEAGMGFILSPLTRATVAGSAGPANSSQNETYGIARDAQRAWFEDEGFAIGPDVSDQQIVSGGGPHQVANGVKGSPRIGVRLAIAAARFIGLDTTTDPTVSGAALSAANTVITVSFTLPNGGSLKTDGDDSGVVGLEVSDDTGSTWNRLGFSAVRSGNTVVLTKDSGSWTGGGATLLRYNFGAPISYGTSVDESDLLDGVLYESYDKDPLGLGLPIQGSNDSMAVS